MSSAGWYSESPNDTRAAISRIISVMSWRASHTSWRNVLGGLGGIVFEPKVSLLCSLSGRLPLRPRNNNTI